MHLETPYKLKLHETIIHSDGEVQKSSHTFSKEQLAQYLGAHVEGFEATTVIEGWIMLIHPSILVSLIVED